MPRLFSKKKTYLSFVITILIFTSIFYVLKTTVFSAENRSHYKYIDNFNDGKDPNMIGGKTFYEISPNASIKDTYYNKKNKNVYGKSGYSLKIDYNVPSNEFSRIDMSLNELDISKAEKISFWVKGEVGDEIFYIMLDDGHGQKQKVFIDKVTKEWTKIEIPVSRFKNINFGHMDCLMLDFSIKDFDNKGTIYIDNIAFYSDKPNLFIRSLMDNIAGFPEKKLVSLKRINELINIRDDREFIKEIAADTWIYFRDVLDQGTHLVLDYINVEPKKLGDFTSVTNIGLYMMCVVSAYDLGLLSRPAAIDRIRNLLSVMETLPRWKGLWYNFYSTTNMQISRHYISSVDNGWLSAGFIVTRNAFPELYEKISFLLEGMDYSVLYDKKIGQLNVGYDAFKKELSGYHYGLLCTEPRAASFLAIGKGDIPKDHWFRMYRTLPSKWKWQDQKPNGDTKTALGIEYFQGYYIANGKKIVPSWGGSLFEFLMPTLVMKEMELGIDNLGLNIERAVDAHIAYAEEKNYPVWGISPCSTPDGSNGGYSEFGVPGIGAKAYKEEGVITPHASFLALYVRPRQAVKNLKYMLKLYDIYGEYGFYDAVDVDNHQVAYRYLALDQAMSFIAMNNYLNDGIIRKRFHNDVYIKEVEDILLTEEFFE